MWSAGAVPLLLGVVERVNNVHYLCTLRGPDGLPNFRVCRLAKQRL